MSTKYRGSLGFLALVSLIALSLGTPLRAAAQPEAALAPDAVVAIEPPEVTVDAQETFSVAVIIADVTELRSYELTLAFDPTVVEVQGVEQGAFLGGQLPVTLGPDIDNEAGTVVFGALGMGSGPWPSGDGELATISLKAVRDGFTALDLQHVDLFGGDGGAIATVVEDGEVLVGGGVRPTDTPTAEAVASDTPAPTSAATATEAATSLPEATATKTSAGGATSAPEATATGTRTEAATSPPGATATRPATEEGTPVVTSGATSTAQTGQTPVGEGPPSGTAEPVEGEGEDAELSATDADEPTDGEAPSGVSPWLVVAAVVLGIAGIALIGVGIFAFGLRRRPGGEPMDDV